MKRILIALLVMMTIFSLANAQKQTTIVNDSTGNVKVTVTKGKGKDAKVNVGNTAVTVIGIDDEDADTTSVDTGKVVAPRAALTEKRASPSALTTMTSRSIISEMQSEEVFW